MDTGVTHQVGGCPCPLDGAREFAGQKDRHHIVAGLLGLFKQIGPAGEGGLAGGGQLVAGGQLPVEFLGAQLHPVPIGSTVLKGDAQGHHMDIQAGSLFGGEIAG